MSRKVAIVGSTRLQVSTPLGAEIVDLVRSCGDIVLLTRGSGEVDHFIATIAPLLELRCFSYPSGGGRDNWVRDVELATDADAIIAIVAREDLEKASESGTLHVVQQGLNQDKPVRLFSVVDGGLVEVAENP